MAGITVFVSLVGTMQSSKVTAGLTWRTAGSFQRPSDTVAGTQFGCYVWAEKRQPWRCAVTSAFNRLMGP